MNTLAWHQKHGPLSLKEYLAFLETRPEEEHWQLIDGVAVMMPPPTLVHQVIAMNLIRLLNDAFAQSGQALVAVHEAGLIIPGFEAFRPEVDVAVVPTPVPDESYVDTFLLTAEVLSASNREEYIGIKRERYAAAPANRYTLIIDKAVVRVEVLARSSGWSPTILVGAEARLELPELGLNAPVGELYRRTPLDPMTARG